MRTQAQWARWREERAAAQARSRRDALSLRARYADVPLEKALRDLGLDPDPTHLTPAELSRAEDHLRALHAQETERRAQAFDRLKASEQEQVLAALLR